MGQSIESVQIAGTGMEERWGINIYDYKMEKVAGEGMTQVDFRDLTTFIAERRAVEIEKEIKPLSDRIIARNKRLEIVGKATSEMAAFTAKLPTDGTDPTATGGKISRATAYILAELSNEDPWKSWAADFDKDPDSQTITKDLHKSQIDKATQLLKTESDRLNNDAQLDMNRMQGVVQHRDSSYNTATSMMTSISDSVSTAIRSMS